MTMRTYFKAVLLLGLVMPACDGLVCSRERMKAMEYTNTGVDEFKNSLYDSAERDFKLAIQTDPGFDLAHYNLGKLYQKQRKWDKAVEALEGATQKAPNNANYFYDLGEAYYESKKMDQSEQA